MGSRPRTRRVEAIDLLSSTTIYGPRRVPSRLLLLLLLLLLIPGHGGPGRVDRVARVGLPRALEAKEVVLEGKLRKDRREGWCGRVRRLDGGRGAEGGGAGAIAVSV